MTINTDEIKDQLTEMYNNASKYKSGMEFEKYYDKLFEMVNQIEKNARELSEITGDHK